MILTAPPTLRINQSDFEQQRQNADVRFWHKADITTRSTNVRFWG
jgi:hypothetical protein